tara:strand:- start:1140 stop:1556 length:417 start_codon:yes stop_codon:yes gene_type:complete
MKNIYGIKGEIMKKVFVIKTSDDGNISVATNKKEVVNIVKKYVQKIGKNLKAIKLVEGESGELVPSVFATEGWKTVEINDKAYWNKVYTNICKQLRDGYFAYFEFLYMRDNDLNAWDSINIEIQDFETNKLNGEKRNG